MRNKEEKKYSQHTSERVNGWLDVAADSCQTIFAEVNNKKKISKEKQCRLITLNVFWVSVV